MDGRLSKSQLGEDKEKQIKLENLIVEETKSVVTIDHWKKMLSMKAEAICSVNNEAGNSNMAATNPIDETKPVSERNNELTNSKEIEPLSKETSADTSIVERGSDSPLQKQTHLPSRLESTDNVGFKLADTTPQEAVADEDTVDLVATIETEKNDESSNFDSGDTNQDGKVCATVYAPENSILADTEPEIEETGINENSTAIDPDFADIVAESLRAVTLGSGTEELDTLQPTNLEEASATDVTAFGNLFDSVDGRTAEDPDAIITDSANSKPFVQEVENSEDNATASRALTAVGSIDTKHAGEETIKTVADNFNEVSRTDDNSFSVDIIRGKNNETGSSPTDADDSTGIKPMGDKSEIVGGNSTDETSKTCDSSIIKSVAAEKEITGVKASSLRNLKTKVSCDSRKGREDCNTHEMKNCKTPSPQKAKQAGSCEKQAAPKQGSSGKKPPLHRLMMNYAELKEQVENEESKKTEGCRKSGRPRKIPDKFVAEPASIFLNPLSAKERRKQRKMLKKELKRQKEAEKKAATELRLAQKKTIMPAFEKDAMNSYATNKVQPLASSLATKTKHKNTARRGVYKTRQFPEQLILLLATKSAPKYLWWIPTSNGKAFAVDCAWFGERAMQKFFPNSSFGRIVQCLKKWGFRKVTSRKIPDGFSAFEHPLFQRSQPGLVKLIKLGDSRYQKTRRRLAAHPVRPIDTPKPLTQKAQSGVNRQPLEQTHTNYDTATAMIQIQPKPVQKVPQQKLVLERAPPQPPSLEGVDLTVYQPNVAPINIKKKRAATEFSRQDQAMSKRSRMFDVQGWKPPHNRGSTKALAAQNIAALAASVRSGRSGGQSTMDSVRADWEMQDKKPAAALHSIESYQVHNRHESFRLPYESANTLDSDGFTQGQLKQHADFYAAASKQREDTRALKMKTLALQEEIAQSQRRVKERERQKERAQSQPRAMEREQHDGMARKQRLIRERQQQKRLLQQQQQEMALKQRRIRDPEQQMQRVRLPERPVEDSEAARRRRLASALFGSNSISRATAKEAPKPKPSPSTNSRGPAQSAPDRRGADQKPQKKTVRRTSAQLLAVARPTPSSSGVPRAMATSSQAFLQSLPFSNNGAQVATHHGTASQQQHIGGPLPALVAAGVDANSAAARQPFGAHFPAIVTDPMALLRQQQQQQQQNLALMGFPQQAMVGLPGGNNNVDLQQFMMMQQQFQ